MWEESNGQWSLVRHTIIERQKLLYSYPLMWGYIGTLHEDHNPRTSNEACRLVT